MSVRSRDRRADPIRYGGGTSWQGGSYRVDISTGVFSTVQAALAYAAGVRAIRVSGQRLIALRAQGPDVTVNEDRCLGYDVDVLLRDQSWANAALPWHELLAAIASGQPFTCVGRVALPVAPDVRPTSAESRAGATDLPPVQCGQSANWLRETTSM